MSRLLVCPDCRREVSTSAPACRWCGRQMGKPGPSPYWLLALIPFALIATVLIGAGVHEAQKGRGSVSGDGVDDACPTMDKFGALAPGMSGGDVADVMGTPGVVESETNVGGHSMVVLLFRCTLRSGAVTVVLSDGALSNKTQRGL